MQCILYAFLKLFKNDIHYIKRDICVKPMLIQKVILFLAKLIYILQSIFFDYRIVKLLQDKLKFNNI